VRRDHRVPEGGRAVHARLPRRDRVRHVTRLDQVLHHGTDGISPTISCREPARTSPDPKSVNSREGVYGTNADTARRRPNTTRSRPTTCEFPLAAGRPIPPVHRQQYDAAICSRLAIQKAGGATDHLKLRERCIAVSKTGKTFGPGQTAEGVRRDQVRQDIDYKGASGNVDFDDNGTSSALHRVEVQRTPTEPRFVTNSSVKAETSVDPGSFVRVTIGPRATAQPTLACSWRPRRRRCSSTKQVPLPNPVPLEYDVTFPSTAAAVATDALNVTVFDARPTAHADRAARRSARPPTGDCQHSRRLRFQAGTAPKLTVGFGKVSILIVGRTGAISLFIGCGRPTFRRRARRRASRSAVPRPSSRHHVQQALDPLREEC